MCWKYTITYRNYDDKFFRNYSSQWLILALTRLLYVSLKYQYISFEVRK